MRERLLLLVPLLALATLPPTASADVPCALGVSSPPLERLLPASVAFVCTARPPLPPLPEPGEDPIHYAQRLEEWSVLIVRWVCADLSDPMRPSIQVEEHCGDHGEAFRLP